MAKHIMHSSIHHLDGGVDHCKRMANIRHDTANRLAYLNQAAWITDRYGGPDEIPTWSKAHALYLVSIARDLIEYSLSKVEVELTPSTSKSAAIVLSILKDDRLKDSLGEDYDEHTGELLQKVENKVVEQ